MKRVSVTRSWLAAPLTLAVIVIAGPLPAADTQPSQPEGSPQAHADDAAGETRLHPPFAIVELFTSEGSAKCPPAERLVARIDADGRAGGDRIFTLAFHVDYWNILGWPDPYSDPAFSTRQSDYALAFNMGSTLDTPQLIVNGRTQIIDPDEPSTRQLMAEALQTPATAGVTIRAEPPSRNRRVIEVAYVVVDAPLDAVLHVALVQRGIVSHVKRGENANQTLHHAAVVRRFTTRHLMREVSGTVKLTAPADVDPAQSSIIAYVQEPVSMAILGAAAIDLAGPTP